MPKSTSVMEDNALLEVVLEQLNRQKENMVDGLLNEIELTADEVLEWVAGEFTPEDVFDEDALESWALENGFVKEDE